MSPGDLSPTVQQTLATATIFLGLFVAFALFTIGWWFRRAEKYFGEFDSVHRELGKANARMQMLGADIRAVRRDQTDFQVAICEILGLQDRVRELNNRRRIMDDDWSKREE